MLYLLLKWAVATVTMWILATYTPIMHADDAMALGVAALILGFLNATLRPFLNLISFPVNVYTYGLFSFVINGLMLWLIPYIVKGITVTNFWWAMLGAFIISFASSLLDSIIVTEAEA